MSKLDDVWCVRHREGWCIAKYQTKSAIAGYIDGIDGIDGSDANVPTLCRHFVTMPFDFQRGVVTCLECEQRWMMAAKKTAKKKTAKKKNKCYALGRELSQLVADFVTENSRLTGLCVDSDHTPGEEKGQAMAYGDAASRLMDLLDKYGELLQLEGRCR